MHVFWARGYVGASLNELIEAMGLSKSSFYETFGSKHELFLASLDFYRDTVLHKLAEHLAGAPSPRAAIAEGLAMVIDKTLKQGDRRGCFIGNCATETASGDRAVAARVTAGMAHIEEAFHGAVARAQAVGEIPARHDARALARFLTSSLNGLRVMAEANRDRAALEDVVRITLSALD